MSDEERTALVEIGAVNLPSPIMHPTIALVQDHDLNNGIVLTSGAQPTTLGGKWETRLQQLRAFKEVHGHCNVPRSSKHSSEINSLGEFVHFQRRQFKYHSADKPNTLTQERIQSLNDLGFEWFRRNSKKTGDVVATGGQSRTKRSRSRRDRSTEDVSEPSKKREITTTSTNGNDSNKKVRFKENVWLENLEKLNSFKQRHGHCNVPRKWPDDAKLGEWVHFQRRQYKLRSRSLKNHMTDERIHMLNNLGFEWARNLTRTQTSDNTAEQSIIDGILEPTSESMVEDDDEKVTDYP